MTSVFLTEAFSKSKRFIYKHLTYTVIFKLILTTNLGVSLLFLNSRKEKKK